MLKHLVGEDPSLLQARCVLSMPEWVVHSLGGVAAAELSLACRTGALDVAAGSWWDDVIGWAQVPRAIFPQLRQAGSSWGTIGDLGPELDRLRGATLTVAGHDHSVAAIGTGVIGTRQLMDSCGTAEALLRAIPAERAWDPAAGLELGIATGRHPLAGHYCLMAGLPLGVELGPLFDQIQQETGFERDALDDAAVTILDGGVPEPAVAAAAQRWHDALRHAADRTAEKLAAFESLGGPIDEVRISGGWAANPILNRLKRETFPNVRFSGTSEAGDRGAALMAGLAAGAFASVEDFPEPVLSDAPEVVHAERR